MVDICYPSGTDWTCVYTPEEIAELDPTVKERSEALAWASLSALTGYRVSMCPVTIRPCLAGCNQGTWYVAPVTDGVSPGSLLQPYISNGKWYNGCGCKTDCSCTTLCEVLLPSEVGGIEQVWLEGAVLDPSAYRVDNGNRLVRTDGECWPSCQDMNEDAEGPSAFSVSYYPGVAPNDLLRYAAGILAAEYYLACSGRECRLPNGVTTIARAGMTITVNSNMFDQGGTGITEVDSIIRIYNPYGLRSRPRVMSPDRPRGRITTLEG
jgi:hypothetical protein